MDSTVRAGTYIVAVSGGVDSMALLHMLQGRPDLNLVIAHFDHGIRQDSAQDLELVQQYAASTGLPMVYERAELGPEASEEAARDARYDFLHRARQAAGAQGIITAHHQDDLLETAVHNLLRGTGRRGLSSLRSVEWLYRPLLHVPKSRLIAYAKSQGLPWREDSSNQDVRYRRNAIRHELLPKLTAEQRSRLLEAVRRLHRINHELDHQLTHYLHLQTEQGALDRQNFLHLPHAVAREVMAAWLRNNGLGGYDRRRIERLVVLAKTLRPGQRTDINRNHFMVIHPQKLTIDRS